MRMLNPEKITNVLPHFALACYLVLLAACGGYNRTPADIEPPKVSATTPSNRANGVAINTSIAVSFSEVMSAASLHESISVRDANSQIVYGSIRYSDQALRFTPTNGLNADTSYTARINRNARDIGGNRLDREYSWTFTTGAVADTTAPQVSKTTPRAGAEQVDVDSVINAQFSEAIDPVTLTHTRFGVRDAFGNSVNGTLKLEGNTATFTPGARLAYGMTFTVTLDTALQDVAGNALAAEYVWRFTTETGPDTIAPQVSWTAPALHASAVAINTAVSVGFSEALTAGSVNSTTFTVHDASGAAVSGSVAYNGTTATFTPAAPLAHDGLFTATLSNAITDTAGNRLVAYQWSFVTGSAADATPPRVSQVSPSRDETGVANNNAIVATFTEALDPASVTAASFSVTSNGTAVAGSVIYSGYTAIFRPAQMFANTTQYTVNIRGARDLAGNVMDADYSWSFISGTAPDYDAPAVSSVFPLDGMLGVSINGSLLATFSEPMDASTVTTASVVLQDPAGAALQGTVSYTGTTLTFTPYDALAHGTVYTATVTAAVRDLAGNPLIEVYRWSYTTGDAIDTLAPAVATTVPAGAATQAAANAAISVTFSEPMAAETLNATSIGLRDAAGNVVPGTVGYAAATATFTPYTSLASGAVYTATVTTTAHDLAGNPLAAPYVWSFTTGNAADVVAPTVAAVTPANGALAATTTVIYAVFSEPMDISSLTNATFTLRDANGRAVAGAVTATATMASFLPRTALAYDTPYTATLNTGIRDLSRHTLAANYVWTFATSASPDLAPPLIASVNPVDGESRAAITTSITATFSERLDCTSATTASFTLNSGEVPGRVSCSGNTVIFTPAAPLDTRCGYTAALNNGIRDLSGDALIPYTWTFTTAPWTRQLGSAGADQAFDLAVDAAGNVYVVGATTGALQGEMRGATDAVIVKYNASGVQQWLRQFGGESDEFAYAVAVDSAGDVYLSGYTYGAFAGSSAGEADAFLMKLDPAGKLVWQQQLGSGGDDLAVDLAIAGDSVYLVGQTYGGMHGNTSFGGYDLFVAKFDAAGNRLWTSQWGSGANDLGYGIAIDPSGNLFVAGATLGAPDGNGAAGGSDAFLVKFNANGGRLWSRLLGSAANDDARALSSDAAGNIYIAGATFGALAGSGAQGGADMFLAKYDGEGNLQWTHQVGGSADDRALGVHHDAAGNAYIAGYTFGGLDGANAGGYDTILAKYDSGGNLNWLRQLGSSADDFTFGLRVHGSHVYATGYTYGGLDGNTSAGGHDLFVSRYATDGRLQ